MKILNNNILLEKRIIELNNSSHLGDSIFNMILFYNIKEYIEINNIYINYYCPIRYHDQIKEFICSDNIKLFDSNNSDNNGLCILINNTELEYNGWLINKESYNYFYVKFFNNILKKINIPIIINNLEYEDIDLLNRYKKLNDKYKNIDILIINSDPCSGQYNKNEEEWNNYIINLNNKYKIVTTKKLSNINCTLDDNLTIKDIAALSIKIEILIAINTGIIVGLFNKYTLNNIKKAFIFDNNNYYTYKNFYKVNNLNDINLSTLQ